MKVLKNNFNETIPTNIKVYPKTLTCEKCKSELEYEESDMRIGAFGCAIINCPLCGYDNYIDDEGGITLTKENVEFPTHFHHTSIETGAVDCCNNEEVKKCINKAINYFRQNKNEYNWYTEYGNLCVNVHRYDGDEDYVVTVTNNYYQTCIPFEEEDY